MRKNRTSFHIIKIGSILGKTSRADTAGCSTAKYGIQGFNEALLRELHTDNIKVTCVNPVRVDTHLSKDSEIEPHHNMLQPDDNATSVTHFGNP